MQIKQKTLIVVASVAAGFILVGGATYITISYLGIGKPAVETAQTTKKTPTQATPDSLKNDLKAADTAVKQEATDYKNAQDAINEKQTKLVN